MSIKLIFVVSMMTFIAVAQRSPYAGRGYGYPEIIRTTTPQSEVGNRLSDPTTEAIPMEAMGDRELWRYLNSLPKDRQPFWVLNWKHLQQERNTPKTYEHRPSHFNPSFIL